MSRVLLYKRCQKFLKKYATQVCYFGGVYRDRTGDPLLAKQMLSQLS